MSMGSNNLAAKVQSLNTRIEEINAARTKAEARKSIFESQLNNALKEYKERYGVDLGIGKPFAEVLVLVQSEAKSVGSEISKELDLKSRVVTAVESGDFDTAYDLLGMKAPEVVSVVADDPIIKEEKEVSGTMIEEPDTEGFIEEAPEAESETKSEFGEMDFGNIDFSGITPDEEEKPKDGVGVSGQSAKEAAADVEIAGYDPNDWGFGDILSGSAFGGN